MADLLSQLQPIFRDVFDNPGLCVTRASNAANVAGWDSLAHINLVMAIEQQFDLRFSLAELEGLSNVGEMADLIERKLATR